MSRAFMPGNDTQPVPVVPDVDGTDEARERFLAAQNARLAAYEARGGVNHGK